MQDDETSWAGDFDPFADPEERRVLFAALDSFRQYRRTAHLNTTHRRRQAFYALPSAHWQLLAEAPFSLLDTLNRVDDAIDVNADIADAVLATGLQSFGLPADPSTDPKQEATTTTTNWHDTATAADVQKAHSTIRQFFRDWSAEGAPERAVCYEPVLRALTAEFDPGVRSSTHILVPGAGLGRLVFELCRAGFAAEGNEISYHQLLASSWVLNHTAGPRQHSLYPFALHFSNLHSREQQLQVVQIPDVHPATEMVAAAAAAETSENTNIPAFGSMSMSAADFVVLYSSEAQREAFDAVATVFFIDTAPNLIRYLEAIRHCLKPGGVWVNVGPLLWHFEDRGSHKHDGDGHSHSDQGIGEPGSVELTEEEVLHLIERMGFRLEQRQAAVERPSCGYIQDRDSMLLNLYRPSYWVARKQ
ncbi:hypothetical protein ASPZODRAFT_128685 [Penicilliopsis zonata CBS 506.65]|uniref:carnosine N-methyltransferase n=1 Tax=Penicilliopsis zonata CBS 506.65 TaxID=1073090 RepID=A0A1L9SS91_9EURO|nr:hypothetical protein ASPZODRAFT_128685 [Penicilliopsis zonata CBS 506.65]OJJ50075.1 hypothetical protein ASPZODRAFT_128685 [Penicilliopsis zonata CBS 506.65]